MLTLAIIGFEGHPADVTRLLDLQPSRTALVGQPRTHGKGKPYDFNGWWLEVRSRLLRGRGLDHAEAIAEIVAMLRSREALFQRLRRELKPDKIHIYGAMQVPRGEQCGIWLDASEMAMLAACGIDWGIDLETINR